MSQYPPEHAAAGEYAVPQKDRVVVTEDQIRAMILAWGPGAAQDLNDLDDVYGQPVVRGGEPEPEYQRLYRAFNEQRAALLVDRTNGRGERVTSYLWMSVHGVVYTEPEGENLALQRELSGSVYRALIDALGLVARPSPMMGVERVKVSGDVLERAVEFENGADTPAAAYQEIADAVRSQAPEIADCLVLGEVETTLFMADWAGADQPKNAMFMFLNTPAGYLYHINEQLLLRNKNYLEPAPGWAVWAKIVGLLPDQNDMAWWASNE